MANIINTILFTRTDPQKKLQIIEAFTESELLSISYATILRMIKEAGTGDSRKTRCKFKTLYIGRSVGNEWNSHVTNLYNWKKDEVFMSVYIQGDDTDTDVDYKLRDFLDNRWEEQCLGYLHESFSNGYEHKVPANYDRADRARVIRAICNAYIKNKYADKLCAKN